MGEESFQERFSHNLGRLLVLRSAEKEYQLAEGGRRKGNVHSCVGNGNENGKKSRSWDRFSFSKCFEITGSKNHAVENPPKDNIFMRPHFVDISLPYSDIIEGNFQRVVHSICPALLLCVEVQQITQTHCT